jgi:hypothetical protein
MVEQTFMKEITKFITNEKEIMQIDYSNCNEDRMIGILSEARTIIRNENKPHRVLAIFNEKSFLTPKVMRYFNTDRLDSSLLERQATIGVTVPKQGIINGHNILEGNDIRIFESKEEAIRYLAE